MGIRKNRSVAAVLSVAVLASIIPVSLVRAEEGMFMMDKLANLPLAQKGLKISPTEIYNPSGGGISEAVPRLSIGCSSEFVSPDGLILTNHHCAIDALGAASSVQANYGEIGYKANNRMEELSAKDYSIDITLKEEDVTAQVLNGISATDSEMVKLRVANLEKDANTVAGDGIRVQIQALNDGLYFYKFTYQTIKDIRVVYAPPYSVGQFGGDPDNFEWTRHGGDFAFLRAYVGRDGKPAEYSKDNVPFKPKKFLTISTEGLKENDFTMIIGYPGGTTRYRESYSVAFNQKVRLPFLADFLRESQTALEAVGRDNEAKRVALQTQIFELSNSRKAFEGGVVAMRRANIVEQKQKSEARLREWIGQDASRQSKYGAALDGLKATYDEYLKTAEKDLVLQFMTRIEPLGFVAGVISGQLSEEDAKTGAADVLKSEPAAKREVLKFLLRRAALLPANQKIAALEKRFGASQGEARIKVEDEFARQALENQAVTTESGLTNLAGMTPDQLKTGGDPLVSLVRDLFPEIGQSFAHSQTFNAAVGKYRLPYTQAIIEMNNTTAAYPDANFTQRFTYGAVKGYSPREAISYSPFTTLDGVFEKDTGREPFRSPAKLRDLWQRKDYGSYAVNNTIPVDFLSTNDIIGGNSGSPVMNARGEQVGIAFDGNYEGLGDDFFFSPALDRTISVDIRYVLFLTDKFGEAGWILKEMKIT